MPPSSQIEITIPMVKRFFLLIMVLFLLTAAALAGVWAVAQRRFAAVSPVDRTVRVDIPRGAGLRHITALLRDGGLLTSPVDAFVFEVMVKHQGMAAALQAGEFAIPPHSSMAEVAAILAAGRHRVHYTLTIPEGLTSPAVVALVEGMDVLRGTVSPPVPTGRLLPETYAFLPGERRDEAIARMRAAMDKTLDEMWPQREGNLPLARKEEALILASVVEKETALARERPKVAAVFINRLRKGMPLQSDPTVIYGLAPDTGRLGRALLRSDLVKDHPWNTYTRPGLPQSPIANPGRASLFAVLHPAPIRALYFVADGRGGHVFANTLAEHNRNVARWRKLKQKQRRGNTGRTAR